MTDFPPVECCQALARAIIKKAFQDLRDPDHAIEAAAWLYGRDASVMLAALDLPWEPAVIGAAIESVMAPDAPTRMDAHRWIRHAERVGA